MVGATMLEITTGLAEHEEQRIAELTKY